MASARSARRSHQMALRNRPAPDTPPWQVTILPAIVQTGSILFSLPPELRNRIYHYIFAPRDIELVDGESAPIALDTVANIPASDALLRTCRLAYQELRGIFDRSPAKPEIWENNTFVLHLNDARYNEFARLEEENKRDPLHDDGSGYENPFYAEPLADWPFTPDIYLELGDKQLAAMKRLIVSVKADNGSCEAHLIERARHWHGDGEKYWHLDQTASMWDGILVSKGYLDQRSLHALRNTVQINAQFPLPSFLRRRGSANIQRIPNAAMTVKAFGGSRYAFMKGAYDFDKTLHVRRWALMAMPQRVAGARKEETVKRKIAKRDQLDLFMEHCWVVFRARKDA